ncbi:dephospho-CoA kinase [Rhizobium lemnae]|uniref:Dephospho-CoA kinase n=1 Tax=Rhizobium lemnae TaxID=1214924 RepID=A0ABV8E8B9_9HYPH|nr:dephospho-CoA kinase [Rhizobium lemnae]MCJ8508470.1 dephospho-CoA kinase [Rhizobium lemnae]
MIRIGLTGSIGMGKSTTAKLFAEQGVPVNDADQVVHELYAGSAVAAIENSFPGTSQNGVVNRTELSRQLALHPERFKELEAIIHPLVRERERAFLERQQSVGQNIVLLDIPLLFETGAEDRVDVIVVVSCEADLQRQRVLARPGMTAEKFDLILSRQMPDIEKRKRADFVIDTGQGIEEARRQVIQVLKTIRSAANEEAENHA